jgi:hypothetical protein
MTTLSLRRIGAFAALSFLTLTILTACSPSAKDHAAAEAYIRAHVAELSPTPAVLGGTFRVTRIDWQDDDTAIVSYEDGHVALKGRTDVAKDDDGVTASSFVIVNAGSESTSSSSVWSASSGSGSTSSAAERPRAKEGELCGGIAGIQCDVGLMCLYDGAYPDAAGKCSK